MLNFVDEVSLRWSNHDSGILVKTQNDQKYHITSSDFLENSSASVSAAMESANS